MNASLPSNYGKEADSFSHGCMELHVGNYIMLNPAGETGGAKTCSPNLSGYPSKRNSKYLGAVMTQVLVSRHNKHLQVLATANCPCACVCMLCTYISNNSTSILVKYNSSGMTWNHLKLRNGISTF